jgi:parvulin-like peptidyl-prolyl isomerase
MLRFFSGMCQLPRLIQKLTLAVIFLPPGIGVLTAITILCATGCSSEAFSLAAQGHAAGAGSPEIVCDPSLLNVVTDDASPRISTSAAQSRPVTRSQKPDTVSTVRNKPGSMLDLAAFNVAAPENGEVAARIRATVNGVAILDEEVREAVYPYLLATQSLPEPERTAKRKEIFQQELQALIEREVVLQDAYARLKDRPLVWEKFKEAAGKEFDKKMKLLRQHAGLKSDEEFKAYLRAQGLTVAGVRRQIERKFMADEYMRNRVLGAIERICHEQIQEYYQQHPEEFQIADSVIWQDIFIDANRSPSRDAARQFAEKIIAKARAGEEFQQLVTQYDNGDSSYRNGEGYGHRRGEIKPPDVESVLFNLRDGEIGPLVELTNGFHVIRLVKREYAGPKPFDNKTQTAIRNKLQMAAYEREAKRVLADLKRKAAIEISASTP